MSQGDRIHGPHEPLLIYSPCGDLEQVNIKITYFEGHQLVALVATALKLVAIFHLLLSVVRLAVATQLAITELQVLLVEDFM